MWFVGFWLHYVMIFNSFQSRNYNSCIEVVELLKNLFLTELISASPHIWKIREWHWQIVSKFFLDYTQREKVVIWNRYAAISLLPLLKKCDCNLKRGPYPDGGHSAMKCSSGQKSSFKINSFSFLRGHHKWLFSFNLKGKIRLDTPAKKVMLVKRLHVVMKTLWLLTLTNTGHSILQYQANFH